QHRSYQHLGGGRATADELHRQGICPRGRAIGLRTEFRGQLPTRRRFFRQNSAGDEARRHPGRAADQVRSGRQPDHRQGAWAQNIADLPRPRRRGDRMRRREFITLVGSAAAAWPLAARAQAGRLPTIGFFGPNTALAQTEWTEAFVQRLRELDWIEGRTISIEYRWADGRTERLVEIAAELVRLKVDVVVTQGGAAVLAAKQATSIIPIIFAVAGDPVGTGLVASLARPGGNVTGLSILNTDLVGKRLELLREVIPDLLRL